MVQTGWERTIARSAQDQTGVSISVSGEVSGGSGSGTGGRSKGSRSGIAFGRAGGSLGVSSQESGMTNETATAQLNIINYDVRQALANAEQSAARSPKPAEAFSTRLADEILGSTGLRNRYLGDADSGRGVVDLAAPMTSMEQVSILKSGRLSTDLKSGPFDGNPDFKKGAD